MDTQGTKLNGVPLEELFAEKEATPEQKKATSGFVAGSAVDVAAVSLTATRSNNPTAEGAGIVAADATCDTAAEVASGSIGDIVGGAVGNLIGGIFDAL